MTWFGKFGLALAALSVIAQPTAQGTTTDDFFRGKTVNYVVATAPGGGYDGYGRLTARYMEKHLPGSTFVVINRPGAGHMIGANIIYNAKPDGLTMGTFNIGVIYPQLVGLKAAQYDLGKMSWVGKPASEKRVIMVGIKTPFMNFHDLRAAKEPVPIAISGVGSAAYAELHMLANVFGLNLKLLPGYSGTDDDMAIMRGEVAGKLGSISGQGPMVRNGRGRFVVQIGGARETGYGEMTSAADVAENSDQIAVVNLIAAQSEISRVTAGPPAIPPDRLAALREAYGKAFSDPDLLAEATKMQFSIEPLVGEDVVKPIQAALKQPPRIIEMLKELQQQDAKP